MKKRNEISKFIDGTGTPYYAPVIKSIRDFLKNIDEIKSSQGGALVFFERKDVDSELSDLMMQVFPFKTNIPILTNKSFPITQEQQLTIFKTINKPKPYKHFWHFNQFRTHNNSNDHCRVEVPCNNVIHYNTNEITFTTGATKKEQGTLETKPWKEFFNLLQKGQVEKNTYEQLLFESGCKAVSFVPIPVLSTPSMLLIINDRHLDDNKRSLLRSLYFRSRDTVDSYLYSRLLDALIPHIEVHGKDWKEEDLVRTFVKEICHIILPISYRINDEETKYYYRDWPDGNNSVFELALLDGKYRVCFNLTSFYYMDLEQIDGKSSGPDWDWIHHSEIYKSSCEQSAAFLCKLFKLLHNNWRLLKVAEEQAYAKISEAITHIDIKGLTDSVHQIAAEFQKIHQQREALGSVPPPNQLQVDNDKILLMVDGEELVNPSDFTNAHVAKTSGFHYLRYILAEAKTNGNKISMSYQQLYEAVEVPKKGKVNEHAREQKHAASNRLASEVDEMIRTIQSFYVRHDQEITACLRENKISSKDEFNEGLYLYLGYLRELGKNKISNFLNLKEYKDEIEVMIRLDKLYRDLDAETLNKNIERYNAKGEFASIKKNKYILERDDAGIHQKEFVRECFKAVIKLLRKKQEKFTGRKASAMKRLLANLEESGLIGTSYEPKSQTTYSYNQANLHRIFIDWHF